MGALKVRPDDIATLRKAVAPYMTKDNWDKYKAAGLSDVRFLHDTLYAAERASVDVRDFVHELYKYVNDDHITSALRAIWKEIAAGG